MNTKTKLFNLVIGMALTIPCLIHTSVYAKPASLTPNALRAQAGADFAVCGYPDNRGRFDLKLDGHDLGVHPPTIVRDEAGKPVSISGHIVHIYNNWFDDQYYYHIPFQDGKAQKPDITVHDRGIGAILDLLPLEIIDSLKIKINNLEIGLKPDKLSEAAAEIQTFVVGHGWQGQAAALISQIALTATIPNYCSQFHWTEETSEEGNSIWCGMETGEQDTGAIGFSCRGNNCDNVRLACARVPEWTWLDYSTFHWSGEFSEEGAAHGLCNDGNGIVTGLECTGRYCDNINLACSKPVGAKVTNCRWSPWLSEENGGVYNFGKGNFITEMKCKGSYCDNKKFRVCSLEQDPNVAYFEKPKVGEYRLDFCRWWSADCGTPAADAFCRSVGYEVSLGWLIDQNIGAETPTKILETGEICDQSFCDGFKVILCQK